MSDQLSLDEQPDELCLSSGETCDRTRPLLSHVHEDAMVAEDMTRGREGSGVCAMVTTQGAEGGVRRELYTRWVGLGGQREESGWD